MRRPEHEPQSLSDAFSQVLSDDLFSTKEMRQWFEKDREKVIEATQARLYRVKEYAPDQEFDLRAEAEKAIKDWVKDRMRNLQYDSYLATAEEWGVSEPVSFHRFIYSDGDTMSPIMVRFKSLKESGLAVGDTVRTTKGKVATIVGLSKDCLVRVKTQEGTLSVGVPQLEKIEVEDGTDGEESTTKE